MKDKFQELIKNERLTAAKLAEMLEIQPAVISHLSSGRNKPSFNVIQKILRRFPQINPDWLLLDDERMYRDGYEPAAAKEAAAIDLFSPAYNESDSSHKPDEERAENYDNTPETLTSRESHISAPMDQRSEISNSRTTAKIERVIVFYSDGTFQDFDKR